MTKVLVVDDDPDLAAIFSLALKIEGYDICVAIDGMDAYQRLLDEGIDVVLLDVTMPEMDGLTVCTLVKRDPKMRHLPIIIMSASRTLLHQARYCSADAVINKPFDLGVLIDTVSHFAPAD